ncbi:MAG: glycosyltransferase family 4 protein [Solirubrobacterales bacterium]|nr:glycosyltransferase family 4 protein [Solirubrobacterales bacterium]MCB8970053.1 glycosyltransferase family 4 protein [Thermoleophilales bacterium]
MRTRLLTVGPIPPEWGGRLRGGVTRFNVTLLDELRLHPWRHRIDPIGVLIPPPQRVLRLRAQSKAPLPIFMQPKEGRPRRFTSLLLERERPDVVLLNNLAAFNGARYSRVQHAVAPELPVVAVVHEWRAIRAKGEEERAERYRRAAQAGLDSVSAVVFPSAYTRDLGPAELGLRYPERALVIPNPLQPGFAEPGIDVSGPREGVAFVGSFNPRKNAAAVLRAAAATPGLSVTMQGRGPLEEELRALTSELGIGDRVEFAPFVKPKLHVGAVIEVMRSAELVCLPSFSESFGLVMIEALAAGAPVAGFGPTLREIRDSLGIDVGEPIDDPTPDNVGAAIEAIRSRSWDRERLRRAALSEFSAATVTRRYARLLRSVA